MRKDLVKQDINFLEFPLWLQDKDLAEQTEGGFVWKDREGFVYHAGYKPPIKADLIVLLALLLRSQEQGSEKELELTRYQLLQDCGFNTKQGSKTYKRLEESLERWMHVVVTFEGTFYESGRHVKKQFHILEDWELDRETKKLKIQLSSKWIEHIKKSNYFKMLDFEQIKALCSPLATRLYELLVKTFQQRKNWSISARKLAEKIPMSEQYPAHIIPKIKAAVNRINEKTELQIKLTIRRPKRGKAIFDFEKLESKGEEKARDFTKPQILDVSKEDLPTFQGLIGLMPEKEQGKKSLRELVSRKLRKYGADYVKRNILYANKKATTNYRIFLGKALKEDWGAGYMEDLQQAQEQRQRKVSQAELEQREKQEEERLHKEARKRLVSMTPEEKKELEEEARADLSPELLKSDLVSSFLRMKMHAILANRIQKEYGY